MSDQGQWFKLWVSCLTDPCLSNLSLEDFARWCRLGCHIKEHGQGGILPITPPCRELQFLFNVETVDDVILCLKRLPNVVINDNGNLTVSFKHWHKYQVDPTGYRRLKKYREKQNDNGVRQRQRQRHKTKEKPPISPPQKNTTPPETTRSKVASSENLLFKKFWSVYPERNGKKLEKQETYSRFLAINQEEWPSVVRAAENYAASELVKKGMGIKDPKRFLKAGNGTEYWREWIEPEGSEDRVSYFARLISDGTDVQPEDERRAD